jgi:hypothetical protein
MAAAIRVHLNYSLIAAGIARPLAARKGWPVPKPSGDDVREMPSQRRPSRKPGSVPSVPGFSVGLDDEAVLDQLSRAARCACAVKNTGVHFVGAVRYALSFEIYVTAGCIHIVDRTSIAAVLGQFIPTGVVLSRSRAASEA